MWLKLVHESEICVETANHARYLVEFVKTDDIRGVYGWGPVTLQIYFAEPFWMSEHNNPGETSAFSST